MTYTSLNLSNDASADGINTHGNEIPSVTNTPTKANPPEEKLTISDEKAFNEGESLPPKNQLENRPSENEMLWVPTINVARLHDYLVKLSKTDAHVLMTYDKSTPNTININVVPRQYAENWKVLDESDHLDDWLENQCECVSIMMKDDTTDDALTMEVFFDGIAGSDCLSDISVFAHADCTLVEVPFQRGQLQDAIREISTQSRID